MFGIFFAIFCALALVRLWRGPRFGHYGAYGPCGYRRQWDSSHHDHHSRHHAEPSSASSATTSSAPGGSTEPTA